MRIPALARVIILMSVIIAVGVAGFLFISQQSDGSDRPADPLGIAAAAGSGLEQSGITVQGIGEVRIEPDTAFLSLGVQHVAETAAEATAALSTDSNSVVEAVKAAGVDAADVATQSLSLTPIYARPGPDKSRDAPPKIDGYRAATAVLVTVRPKENASAVLDAALSAGANVINSIRFGYAEPAELERQALDAATRDAARKADAMAAALGGEVRGLIWIVEQSTGVSEFIPQVRRVVAIAESLPSSALPIEAGRLTITATVRANFAYK